MKHTGFTLSRNEWLVMEALWERPSTPMELVRQLGQEPPGWAKSTTATMVRRMEEKGLIRHEAGSKARVYHPALSRDETALAETRTLLDKAFDGSVGLLVNTLIQQNSLTQSDLDGLYEILRQAEEGEEESK